MAFLKRLFSKPDPKAEAAKRLANAVFAGTRQPALFLKGYARDDFDGRFQMAALHGGLVMRRLKVLGGEALVVSEKLGEALFDRFDYAYREEGVGDASIARKVRKLGERYFGLARAMDGALEGEEPLEAVLSRNGLGQESVNGLADYARQADAALAQTSEAELMAGEISWPAP